MTVLHVFSGDLWAGAEVMIFNLLSRLHADRAAVVVALSLNEGVLVDRLRAVGISTHVISEKIHAFPAILRHAARLLADTRIDIIHSHRYKENLLAWLLARRLGVSETITTIHGLPESATHSTRESWRARWRTRLDYCVVKRGFRRAVAVSDEMKRVLILQYGFRGDKVRVIRNGAAIPPASPRVPRPKGKSFHIGTVARLVPVKGLDLFIDVAAALRRETPLVRFSLLGDGPLREELSRKAAKLNLDDCLEFFAPRPDPTPYYRTLDLYLNTSLHEGIPLSVIEAMACGVPVVSSAVGGIPEIVTHGEDGFLVEGREARRFADRCLSLIGSDQLRVAMGERASARARSHFSASAMANAYRGLYDECGARMWGASAAVSASPHSSARGR